MDPRQSPRPPRWATRFLSWYCRPGLLEDLEGDLNEYFDRNVKSKGVKRARLIYIADVLKFMRIYTLRRPPVLNPLISWIMIGSYLKTARRSLVRNKLFSVINIVGLAVSMSVGLLMIAFVTDLRSYNAFHEKKDRIYRVTTLDENTTNGQRMRLASTSVKAAKAIKASVAGIDHLTLMRNDFSGNAEVGEKKLPISGFWADESFFDVFTFPLLQGNPATALKEPYSVVLTEKTSLKLFGTVDALGKWVKFDTTNYLVTGVMRDIPKLSYLRFDALGSFHTVELRNPDAAGDFMSWGSIWMNYIFMALPEGGDPAAVQAGIDRICAAENALLKFRKIGLALQPLNDISISWNHSNEMGPTMHIVAVWVLVGLAVIVILSACFNYTNLSIARALRRSREVGIRKIVGARRLQVMMQFVTEAVVVALLALAFALLFFFFLRKQFIGLDSYIERQVSLELTWRMVLYFIVMAIVTGVVAGIFPAVLFSRLHAVKVLKDASSLRLFRRINVRKGLIVVQYVFSLVFITTTVIGYKQYQGFLAFDLGFKTDNILNIWMHGNKSDTFIHELESMPEVTDIAQSQLVTSLGSAMSAPGKYKDPHDSVNIWINFVDDRYLSMHEHTFVAGKNFVKKPPTGVDDEVIVTEQVLKRLDIGGKDPLKAIGEELVMDQKKFTIIGVLKDFHYETVEDEIGPVAFRYDPGRKYSYVNARINTEDWPAMLTRLEAAWEKVDKIHGLDAKFYDDQIEHAYGQFSMMIKVIGFLAVLAIFIASMGLFGMVVFTTETKLKEISIRKVLGASEGNLVVFLSRGFLLLLAIAAVIALPATYIFFDRVVLTRFAYHQPIGWIDLLTGLAGVLLVAGVMISSQILRVARTNPASTLKNE
jgi:putative ABC transport system permease protein